MLQDYIAHCTHDVPCDPADEAQEPGSTRRVLSFQREIETAIYNTLPHNLDALLRRHPLKCPMAFVGGLYSVEMKQVGMAMTQKLSKGRVSLLAGSHLFPMEKPQATAAAIEMYWRDMA